MEPTKQVIGISIVAFVLIMFISYVSWQNGKNFVKEKKEEFQQSQLDFLHQVTGEIGTNFEKLHDALYALSQIPKVQFLDKNECLLNMIRTFKMNQHLVEGIFRVDNTNQVRYAYPPDRKSVV